MPFELQDIIPWGRSYSEYCRMFGLSEYDLSKTIVGVGDGPASFNAEGTRKGCSIISIDPIYGFDGDQIERRFLEVREEVLRQTRANRDKFVWGAIRNIEHLSYERERALYRFLEDYEQQAEQSRYIVGELPNLPFEGKRFDLALVSHLLFLYSEHLSYEFHVSSIRELLRVADEARIFPLLDLGVNLSSHLDPLLSELASEFEMEVVDVDYEFQKGADKMLRIRLPESAV